ncbi:hypothetical protein HY418_01315 [Candidatus Kaiserbacteria bacterium]|nr:hypothetical protein [Candidatus Kaiserbacteria bacterium]
MEQYFYLAWALGFLSLWLILFFLRKDTRKEMLLISGFFGFGGLASEATYVRDWWQPLTLTNTSIGVEDFIIGFAIGGVAAVIYEELYHRRLRRYALKRTAPSDPGFFLLIFPILYLSAFFLLHVNSFYSTALVLSALTVYMLITRRDLIIDSLVSGVAMTVIGIGMYLLLLLINPNFIQDHWYLPDAWYAKELAGIPLGEYIWYFLVGAYIGPLYEYLKRFKFARVRRN